MAWLGAMLTAFFELGQGGLYLLQQQKYLGALVVHIWVLWVQAFRLSKIGYTLFALIQLDVESCPLYVGIRTQVGISIVCSEIKLIE